MPVLAPPLDPATSRDDHRPSGRRPSPRRSRSGVVRLAAALALAVVALLGTGALGRLLPDIRNPFTSETVDRTGPALLRALEDLHEYRAATGHFQVVVDVEDDTRFVPSVLKGQRTLFVAVGSVDATVDFSGLDERMVSVSDDRLRASITLPPATLGAARVDPARSYVADRDRGLLDRVGSMFSDSPTGERQLYLLAEQRLAAAAREATELREQAERNTQQMLEAMLAALGFTEVTVTFAAP